MKITAQQVHLDGEHKGYYYAVNRRNETHDTKDIAAKIEAKCTLTKGDIEHVLFALSEVMNEELITSNSVHLNGIGTFIASPVNKGAVKSLLDVTPDLIDHVKVTFRAENQKVGSAFETRADGSMKETPVYQNILVKGVKFEEDLDLAKMKKVYKEANNVGG
jgi:predicted histone-like DNA-binding protein